MNFDLTPLGGGAARTPDCKRRVVAIYEYRQNAVWVLGSGQSGGWLDLHKVEFEPWAIPILMNILERAVERSSS